MTYMQMHMQAMTAKELEYIADSMSNEDLLIKQCAATAASSQNQIVQQTCIQMMKQHQQNYQTLMQALHQHQSLAPTQVQSH